MTAPHPDERSIFLRALEISSTPERIAFLDQTCGTDPALRAAVESLLKAHDRPQPLLDVPDALRPTSDGPVGNDPVGDASPGVGPGRVIGPYKLLQQIGEGGMGTVFMAEQTAPVQRKVALKIIKPGMNSRQVIARFEAERQALALMDHPNIARVLDAGETADRRPYFVMELVRGVPMTRYCDEHRLSPRMRLELFVSVCQGVQHAHQKGIIHRDLKPSNVLVCQYDGVAVAKVIDFGVAKATGQKLTAATLFTEFGQVVGTPEYMSPEQAELNQLDVDTRSDIYALGVLAYELLTGTTPLQHGRIKEVALLEVLRLIREEEPPTPSARLSTTEELPTIAANRGLEPKALNGLVRGELDWIAMKCLEKDRNRRYETANGLAADVRRYLSDEAVLACPPSARYRLRKFARRNRVVLVPALAVAVVVVLAVASLAGAVVVLDDKNWTITREQDQTKIALAAEVEAKRQLKIALAAEVEAKRQLKHTLYFYGIELADSEWHHGTRDRAEQVLDECPADLRQIEWFYLKRLCHGELLTLPGVRDSAFSVEFSPDGTRLAMVGQDKVLVCDPKTGAAKLSCPLSGAVSSVAFSGDGKHLAGASWGGNEVRVWDATTGQILHQLRGRNRPDRGLAFGRDDRYLACSGVAPSGGPVIIVWDLVTGTETSWNAESPVESAASSRDGRWLAAGCRDRIIRVWEAANGKLVHQLRGHTGLIQGVAFSPDGHWLASASNDQTVRVWDTKTGQPSALWTMHSAGVMSVAFSPDGQRLASGSLDMTVRSWDRVTGLNQFVFRGHASSVTRVAFSPDGKLLASASMDRTIKIWDAAKPQEGTVLWRYPASGGGGGQWSPDGRYLVAPVDKETVKLSDAWTGRDVLVLPGNPSEVVFSPEGDFVATADKERTVRLWDLTTGEEIPTPLRGVPALTALGARGQRLATVAKNVITLWDVKTGAEAFTLPGIPFHTRPVFSPDGRHLLWHPAEGVLSFCDARDGHELFRAADPELWGDWDKFSHDGRLLVSPRKDGTAKLWEPATGRVIPVPRRKAVSLAFSRDDRRLAVDTTDQLGASITLWDTETGTEVLRLRNYTHGPVEFTRDNCALVEAARGVVKVWDARPLQPVTDNKGQIAP
jgi:WD40 repeat protein/serine/threonine protein kinase